MRSRWLVAFIVCPFFGLFSAPAGTVLDFTTTASYVTLGTPAALQTPNNTPLTVEGWMFLRALDSRDCLYSKNNGRSSPYTYMFGVIDSGKIAAYNSGAWVYPTSTVVVSTGVWTHLAFSFDGTNMTFYMNGSQVGSRQPFSYNNTPTYGIKIGGYSTSSDPLGMVSDVRVWNYARSADQIRVWRNSRLTGTESGLIGYWPLDEGTGLAAFDRTANNSTGVITACSWVSASLDLQPAFLLANPITGSTRYTCTNSLQVVSLASAGYTHYQVTENGAAPGENWQALDPLPASITFTRPEAEGAVTLTLWLTNQTLSVAAQSVTNVYLYCTNPPPVQVKESLEREVSPGQPVRIQVADIDNGTTGGTCEGEPIPLYSLRFMRSDAPGSVWTNEAGLPGDGGFFRFRLKAVNEAGVEAVSEAECLVNVLPVTAGYDGFTGLENTRLEWPETWYPRWPQQWLIDYMGGADVPWPTLQAGYGQHSQHSSVYYYLEGLLEDLVRVQTDLRFAYTTTSNHGGVIGRFRPTASGQRRGYRFRLFPNVSAVYLERLTGTTAAVLASTNVPFVSGTVFRMLLQIEQTATNRTTLRGKFWDRNQPEPAAWTLVASDTNGALQNLAGSAGLYAETSGNRYWQFYNFKANWLPYFLVDPVTGSPEATSSNTVRVAAFQAPPGYDAYCLSESATAPESGWTPVTNPPSTFTFAAPVPESWITTYAWFTNQTSSVSSFRYADRIYYTATPPVPSVRPSLSRDIVPGASVRITGADVDAGSTGGAMGATNMAVFSRAAVCLDAGADATPGEPYVTLTAPGAYSVALVLTNSAGIGLQSAAACAVTITAASTPTGDLYVVAGHTNPSPPYASWASAAPDIQTAIDAAASNQTILVWKGVYDTGGRTNAAGQIQNRITADKPVRIVAASANPADTVIAGAPSSVSWGATPYPTTNLTGVTAVRGAWLGTNVWLSGFTIRGGATRAVTGADGRGGGVYAAHTSATVANCIVIGNIAHDQGGGVYGGTLTGCVLAGNRSIGSAGGAASAVLRGCRVEENASATQAGGLSGCTVYGGVVCRNRDRADGAGGGGAYNSTLHGTLVASNRGGITGGGLYGGTSYNCVVVGNWTQSGTAYAGGSYNAALFNCTVTGNRSAAYGGGVRFGRLINTIVQDNSARATSGAESNLNYVLDASLVVSNSCLSPEIAGWPEGNFTNPPAFIRRGVAGPVVTNVSVWTVAPGDYRLGWASPCMAAGQEAPWMRDAQDPRAFDMAGNDRILGGAVDVGAYEAFPGTLILVR